MRIKCERVGIVARVSHALRVARGGGSGHYVLLQGLARDLSIYIYIYVYF